LIAEQEVPAWRVPILGKALSLNDGEAERSVFCVFLFFLRWRCGLFRGKRANFDGYLRPTRRRSSAKVAKRLFNRNSMAGSREVMQTSGELL